MPNNVVNSVLVSVSHVFKRIPLAQDRSHSQPRVGAHTLQFTKILPEATATVAASASKASVRPGKRVISVETSCYPLLYF